MATEAYGIARALRSELKDVYYALNITQKRLEMLEAQDKYLIGEIKNIKLKMEKNK